MAKKKLKVEQQAKAFFEREKAAYAIRMAAAEVEPTEEKSTGDTPVDEANQSQTPDENKQGE